MPKIRQDIIDQKEEIIERVYNNVPKSEICRDLSCKADTLNRYLKLWNISYSGQQGGKSQSRYKPAKEYLKKGVCFSSRTREKIFAENLKDKKCESCGLTHWYGEPILLEIHHKDGDRYNNELENLEVLCPNCHACTDNFRYKNSKNYKDKKILE